MDRSQKYPCGNLPPEFEHTEHCDRTCGGTGAEPYGGLVFDRAGRLYLTTQYGGDQFQPGVVFELARQLNGAWKETVLQPPR